MYRQSNATRCMPYSHQRVKYILKNDYHCILQPILSYKGNRRYGYVQKYNLINEDTGETLVENVTLNAMRIVLTQEGYPVKADSPCQGAMDFLAFVDNIKTKNKGGACYCAKP